MLAHSTLTLEKILKYSHGKVANAESFSESDLKNCQVTALLPIEKSTKGSIGFYFSRFYREDLKHAQPSVLVTTSSFIEDLKILPLWNQSVIVDCEDPYLLLAQVSEIFSSETKTEKSNETFIHPTASVHESAYLEEGVIVGPHCVVESGVRIGAHSHLKSNVFVGEQALIGRDCILFHGVTLYDETQLGDRVRIHAGAVLGADGFGYALDKKSGKMPVHRKIYHVGKLILGNDVEIGANTCIDRGTIKDSIVGHGVKIDNLVQIGHNCEIGDGAVICGQVGIAGSVKIGRFAVIGGQAGINNRITIGDGAQVGGMTRLSRSVPPGGTATGYYQKDFHQHQRDQASLHKMLKEWQSARKKKHSK